MSSIPRDALARNVDKKTSAKAQQDSTKAGDFGMALRCRPKPGIGMPKKTVNKTTGESVKTINSSRTETLFRNAADDALKKAPYESTPTQGSMPMVLGRFDSLLEALDYAAENETGYNFFSARGEMLSTLPYRTLREKAMALGEVFAARFAAGSRIGLVAETRPEFVIGFFACQYAGLVPAPMPMPINLGGREGYILQIHRMVMGAGASAVIGPRNLSAFVGQAVAGTGADVPFHYEDFATLDGERAPLRPFGKDDLCYIQYSSGSTSAPKGVIGTQQSVTNNLRAIVTHGLELKPTDRAVSWLPLYHDMGLIGFGLSPMFAQRSVDCLATSDFVRRPLMWLKLMSANGGTVTYSPSFGYELAAKRAKAADLKTLDLSGLRIAGIGGDMVRADALQAFADAFAPCGFRANAFTPSYGLAEATLAIAFSDLEGPVGLDDVDMRHYTRSGIAQPASAITAPGQKRTFVKCGRVLPGHALEIRNSDGVVHEDRIVGRVMIKGPSVTPGYFSDPEASAAMFHGDWLDTGDMGYMLDDEVVITGRAKDLIIINGRNIWPQDIEWAVEKLDHVRSGGVAAFSIDNGHGETITAVVECRGGLSPEARADLRRKIAQTIQTVAGAPSEVVLVRPHSMVVTSSGKLSRAKVREKYLAGAFAEDSDQDDVNRQAIAK